MHLREVAKESVALFCTHRHGHHLHSRLLCQSKERSGPLTRGKGQEVRGATEQHSLPLNSAYVPACACVRTAAERRTGGLLKGQRSTGKGAHRQEPHRQLPLIAVPKKSSQIFMVNESLLIQFLNIITLNQVD